MTSCMILLFIHHYNNYNNWYYCVYAAKYVGKGITSCCYEHCFMKCEARRSMLGKCITDFLLLWTLLAECEARKDFWSWMTLLRRVLSYPSWIHGQARGWTGQVILAALFYGWEERGCSLCLPTNCFGYVIFSSPFWMIMYTFYIASGGMIVSNYCNAYGWMIVSNYCNASS